jgi:hypothetical protein
VRIAELRAAPGGGSISCWKKSPRLRERPRHWRRDSSLIRGQVIVGEAKEAQGDLSEAGDAFGAALRLFDEQYPKSYESPEYLVYKLGMLQERLGGRGAETPR